MNEHLAAAVNRLSRDTAEALRWLTQHGGPAGTGQGVCDQCAQDDMRDLDERYGDNAEDRWSTLAWRIAVSAHVMGNDAATELREWAGVVLADPDASRERRAIARAIATPAH